MFAVQRTIVYAGGETMRMFYKETSGFGVELTSSLADAFKFEKRETAETCISSISGPTGVGRFQILDVSI